MNTNQHIDNIRKDAEFYYLDHIESAMIPNTTLYGIIQKLKNKQQENLTYNEKSHLILLKLETLHKFVEGKISFNQYKKEAASSEKRTRMLAEQAKHQELLEKRENERRERNEKLAQERIYKQKVNEERIKQEKGKDLLLKAPVADQQINMFENKILHICEQYFIKPLKSNLLITSRLKDIIKKYEEKQILSKFEEAYLQEYMLRSLSSFLSDFQKKVRSNVEVERNNEEKIRREKLRLEAIEKQKLLESDPIYIAKQKQKALLKKYEIHVLYSQSLPKEIDEILNKLEHETRLSQEEAIWLNTSGKEFFTSKLRHHFHRLEANYYLDEYEKNTKNIWSAINASSHLRKCQASSEAEEFLERIAINGIKNKKLLSAYFTTLGGVRRDLCKVKVAVDNASKAHHLTPDNYRPCTLLGAIYMETHQYTLGHEWYEKANERGAPNQSIHADLKSIISKMDKVKRNEMIEHLLKLDSQAYSWLKKLKVSMVNQPQINQNKVESSIKVHKKPSLQQTKKPVQNKQPKNSEKSLKILLEHGAKAHKLKKPVNLSKPSCMKPKKK